MLLRNIRSSVHYPVVIRVMDQHQADQHLRARGTLVIVGPTQAPKWLKLRCPCGCGEIVSVNLQRRLKPAWKLRVDDGDAVSLSPSVWRTSGCRSHFWFSDNRAMMFSSANEYRRYRQAL